MIFSSISAKKLTKTGKLSKVGVLTLPIYHNIELLLIPRASWHTIRISCNYVALNFIYTCINGRARGYLPDIYSDSTHNLRPNVNKTLFKANQEMSALRIHFDGRGGAFCSSRGDISTFLWDKSHPLVHYNLCVTFAA